MTWGGRSSHKVKSAGKSHRATPLLHPIVPESWDNWVYKGGTLTHFEQPGTLRELRQPYVISEHSFTKWTFGGLSFLFWGQFVFSWNRRRISWFLNFFHPKSKTEKTKIVRDLKLRDNAWRIFKAFLAPLLICGCFKVKDIESAATPQRGQKSLKNSSRVIS